MTWGAIMKRLCGTASVVLATMTIASCACGSTDDGDGAGSSDAASQVIDTEVSEDDDEVSGDDEASTVPDNSESSTDPDDSDDGSPPTTTRPAPDDAPRDDRYDEVREFTRGNLRSSYGDNQSDCGTRRDVAATIELAEPASGVDLLVVCLWTAEPPSGSFQLIGPAGRRWTDAALSLGAEIEELSYTFSSSEGNATESVAAQAVEVVESGRRLPVGWSFATGGAQLTTVYLALPTGRPSGAWTANISGVSASADVPTCAPETAGPTSPWITGPIDFLANPFEGDPTIDNCRIVPSAVGLGIPEAIDLLGSASTELTFTYDCTSDEAEFVVDQHSPSPGQLRDARLELNVSGPCPAILDVSGRSVAEAIELLGSSWPDQAHPSVVTSCAPDALVSRTRPGGGEVPTTVREIRIFCEPADFVSSTTDPKDTTTTTGP